MPEQNPVLGYPRIVFEGDGIIATVIHVASAEGDPPKRRYFLLLPPWAKRQAGLADKDLDFSTFSHTTTHMGHYIRCYDTKLIRQIGFSPEFPLFMAKCNIFGQEIDDKSLHEISSLREIISGLKDRVIELEGQLRDKMWQKEEYEAKVVTQPERRYEPVGVEVIRREGTKDGPEQQN